MTFNNRRWSKPVMIVLGIVSILVPVVWSLFKSEIFCDDAYYLLFVERMNEGYIPYKTISLGYMPLWFYLMLALKKIFAIPYGCHIFYHIVHYLFQFGCAFFVYKIIRAFGIKKQFGLFCAWLFVIMSHWLLGNSVLLETPSMFFGLLSIYCSIIFAKRSCWSALWIGIIASLAFLCKQYGAGFLVLDLFVYSVWKGEKIWPGIALMICGFIIPVSGCVLYWGSDFLEVIFSGYGTATAESAGLDFTVSRRISSIVQNMRWFFLRCNPVIVLSLCFIPQIVKQNRLKEYLLCIFGIIGFSLQFFFVFSSIHYYLYIVPFGTILIGLMLSLVWQKGFLSQVCKYSIIGVTILTVFLSSWSTYRNRLYRIYWNSDIRERQYKNAELLQSIVPEGDTIWIHGPFYLYYLANRLSPNLDTIGYSFGTMGLDADEAWEQIHSCDFVVRYTEDYDYLTYFTQEHKSYVESFPMRQLYDSDIVVHDLRGEER